jgi:hypothetical protein
MFQQRPLLLPFLALAVGLTVTDRTGYQLPVYVPAAVLLCLLLSALIWRRTLFVTCIPLFFFVLGLCALSPWKTPTHHQVPSVPFPRLLRLHCRE